MLTALAQWFGAGRGHPGRATRRLRFAARLEGLDDRVLPSVASVSASPDAAQAALLGTRIGSPSDVILLRTGTGSKPGGAGDGVSGTAPHDVEGGGRSDVIPLVSEGVVRPGNNQAGFAITADGSPSDVTPLGSKTVASASSN